MEFGRSDRAGEMMVKWRPSGSSPVEHCGDLGLRGAIKMISNKGKRNGPKGYWINGALFADSNYRIFEVIR